MQHPIANYEMTIIQKYYQNDVQLSLKNKRKFNGVYSTNLPKVKDGAYAICLGEYEYIRTHWIALYVNGSNRRASVNVCLIIQVYFLQMIMRRMIK